MKKTVYDPVKQQLIMALEYIKIYESRKSDNDFQSLLVFKDYFQFVFRQVEIYLNYEIFKIKEKKSNG